MAVDARPLDQPLTRELLADVQPLRFRLHDALLPLGAAPPHNAKLRCCTCGYGVGAGAVPVACPLCGGRAWDVLVARTGVPSRLAAR